MTGTFWKTNSWNTRTRREREKVPRSGLGIKEVDIEKKTGGILIRKLQKPVLPL
jgi:hypothetical protein